MRAQTRDRNRHYADSAARRARVLNITALLAVAVSATFVFEQIVTDTWSWQIGSINLGAMAVFASVPRLHKYGELVAPLTFVAAAYASVFATSWDVGRDSGSELFFLVGACLVVLLLGIEHIVLASALAAVSAALIITLRFVVPTTPGCSLPGPRRWASS